VNMNATVNINMLNFIGLNFYALIIFIAFYVYFIILFTSS